MATVFRLRDRNGRLFHRTPEDELSQQDDPEGKALSLGGMSIEESKFMATSASFSTCFQKHKH